MRSTNTLTLLLFGIMTWSSCSEKKPDVTIVPSATEKIGVNTYVLDIKSDPLPIDKAAKMISNGLNDVFLERLSRRYSIGGYFDKAALKITDTTNKGVIFWPCYNPRGLNNHPEFFLVAEQVTKFDSITDPHKNNKPGQKLIMPIDISKYSQSAGNNEGNVRTEILARKTVRSTPVYPPIDAIQVSEYVANFEKMMMDFSPVKDTSLCKYGQYFFLANSSYDNFLSPTDLKYVQYYMGLAWDKYHKPNYFRPVLTGVRADGTTIENIPATRGGDPFLQKSVPPPPIL